jgi:6-phosphofructokinase 1
MGNTLRAPDPKQDELVVDKLGESLFDSPIQFRRFTQDDDTIVYHSKTHDLEGEFNTDTVLKMEKAGPREKNYFDPKYTSAAIVTCGGLCPGLNNVIKSLVQQLAHEYRVKRIYGIQYGYEGLNPDYGHALLPLTPDDVRSIHHIGGTMLGSSRGHQDPSVMVDTLVRHRINILFTIGGDGTLRGASAIANEIAKRKLDIAVIGLPKTIDNDLNFVGQTFGFESAVYAAGPVISQAQVEAQGAYNGIGLVKLMGRDSGFIAAHASIANSSVSICLIPEQPFDLEGPTGLYAAIERRLKSGRHHMVIVVAEGAGQEFFKDFKEEKDASGNILKRDIGEFLQVGIKEYFKNKDIPCALKYFDPSYQIRSIPAHGTDAIFCTMLAENAVHAAMSGRTNLVVGKWNRHFVYVPIPLATRERQRIDNMGSLWKAVLFTTRQDDYFYEGQGDD